MDSAVVAGTMGMNCYFVRDPGRSIQGRRISGLGRMGQIQYSTQFQRERILRNAGFGLGARHRRKLEYGDLVRRAEAHRRPPRPGAGET